MSQICNIADNIISSLGMTTDENVDAVLKGLSGIRHYTDYLGIREPFSAAMVDTDRLMTQAEDLHIPIESYTRFELMSLVSVSLAVGGCSPLLAMPRTVFILSTTKGNVELLDDQVNGGRFGKERLLLWKSAQLIADYFGNPNMPMVVSNACISGAAAQLIAKRMIESGAYDTAVVIGADVISKFVISGFQSFRALSEERCKPFDKDRIGLNIGEGVGTIVYHRCKAQKGTAMLMSGAVTNDANHISGPSRTGEGLYQALLKIKADTQHQDLQFINVHGTATAYNDAMEAYALSRAGLLSLPTFSLKAYFGHTLGASGTIETIISSHALQRGVIPISLGYEQLGVPFPVTMVTEVMSCSSCGEFIKTVSGFGGCNAAIRIKIEG